MLAYSVFCLKVSISQYQLLVFEGSSYMIISESLPVIVDAWLATSSFLQVYALLTLVHFTRRRMSSNSYGRRLCMLLSRSLGAASKQLALLVTRDRMPCARYLNFNDKHPAWCPIVCSRSDSPGCVSRCGVFSYALICSLIPVPMLRSRLRKAWYLCAGHLCIREVCEGGIPILCTAGSEAPGSLRKRRLPAVLRRPG